MWKPAGSHVTLETAALLGELDLTRPARGIHQLQHRHPSQPAALTLDIPLEILRVHLPDEQRAEKLLDCWVRGDDAFAAYTETAHRPFQPEIYWRVLPTEQGTLAGWELIVSVHTSLLDAQPATSVSSSLPADEIIWLADPLDGQAALAVNLDSSTFTIAHESGCGLVVARLRSVPLSYVEAVYPGDFQTATLQRQGDARELRWHLFRDALEKGVIRRARLRSWLVPRADDTAVAISQFHKFTQSALPLTT